MWFNSRCCLDYSHFYAWAEEAEVTASQVESMACFWYSHRALVSSESWKPSIQICMWEVIPDLKNLAFCDSLCWLWIWQDLGSPLGDKTSRHTCKGLLKWGQPLEVPERDALEWLSWGKKINQRREVPFPRLEPWTSQSISILCFLLPSGGCCLTSSLKLVLSWSPHHDVPSNYKLKWTCPFLNWFCEIFLSQPWEMKLRQL